MASGVTIDFNANLARFTSSIDKAISDLNRFQSNADRMSQNVSAIFSKLGRIMGVSLSVGAVSAYAKSILDAADAYNDMSQRTGVAVKTLAEYELAAKQADTSMEVLSKGIQRLTLSIGQATKGGKAQAEALQALGISATDPQKAFEQLADKVSKTNDLTEIAPYLNDLLGRSYADLLPLLLGGAEGLRQSADASKSWSESIVELAPNAAELNDSIDELAAKAKGAAAAILSKLVPSLREYLAVGEEVVKNGNWLDRLRFFTLGNASDTVVNRVREDLKASSQAMADLRAEASKTEDPAKRLAEHMAKLSCAASGGTWENGHCKKKKTTSSVLKIDKDSLFSDETARNAKMIADEMDRISGDLAFMWEVDQAQMSPIRALQEEWETAARDMVEAAKTPLEQFEDAISYIDELMRRGLITADEYGKLMNKAFEDAGSSSDKAKSAVEEFGLTFVSALEEAIVTGQSVSDMLKGLEQDIARLIVRKSVTEPLMSIDWGSILGSIIPSAKGNIFTGVSGLSAFSGQVVDTPTIVPFATGGALFAEAGPEAILPLTRMSNGELGVSGSGTSVQVNVINNAPGTQASATERQEDGVRIVDVVVEQVEGVMSRRVSRGEGLAPVLERRYALNPAGGAN